MLERVELCPVFLYGQAWEGFMMRGVPILATSAVILLVVLATPARTEMDSPEFEWSVQASYVDACCCSPSCPCLFGSSPTLGYCEGVSLVEFEEASYGDVQLDDLKVVAVYRGKTWIKFYVDERATPEQTEAIVNLLPTYEEFFAIDNVVEVANVPIVIEREKDTIKISTPNTTSHITMMRGRNGEPIQIANLPWPGFPAPPLLDHTQYKTVLLKHESGEEAFEHSGTNGFTANIDADSSTED
jgi:hypothetical protein